MFYKRVRRPDDRLRQVHTQWSHAHRQVAFILLRRVISARSLIKAGLCPYVGYQYSSLAHCFGMYAAAFAQHCIIVVYICFLCLVPTTGICFRSPVLQCLFYATVWLPLMDVASATRHKARFAVPLHLLCTVYISTCLKSCHHHHHRSLLDAGRSPHAQIVELETKSLKSNVIGRSFQNFSSLDSNALTLGAITTSCGREFQGLTTLTEKLLHHHHITWRKRKQASKASVSEK